MTGPEQLPAGPTRGHCFLTEDRWLGGPGYCPAGFTPTGGEEAGAEHTVLGCEQQRRDQTWAERQTHSRQVFGGRCEATAPGPLSLPDVKAQGFPSTQGVPRSTSRASRPPAGGRALRLAPGCSAAPSVCQHSDRSRMEIGCPCVLTERAKCVPPKYQLRLLFVHERAHRRVESPPER